MWRPTSKLLMVVRELQLLQGGLLLLVVLPALLGVWL
jgi:hypothetical protein